MATAGQTDEPTTGQQRCPRCASPVEAGEQRCTNCTLDLAKPAWAKQVVKEILDDIVNGELRVGPTNDGGHIEVVTPHGRTTLKMLAMTVQDAARPVPAFGVSQVPKSVVIDMPFTMPAAGPGEVSGAIQAVLVFMSDDELEPHVENPMATFILNGPTMDRTKLSVKTTWREPDDDEPTTAADAIEQVARSYGWNPEGAKAMGFTELPLGDWLLDTLDDPAIPVAVPTLVELAGLLTTLKDEAPAFAAAAGDLLAKLDDQVAQAARRNRQ